MPVVESLEMLELIDFGGVMEGDLVFLSFQFFWILVGPWTMNKTQRKMKIFPWRFLRRGMRG